MMIGANRNINFSPISINTKVMLEKGQPIGVELYKADNCIGITDSDSVEGIVPNFEVGEGVSFKAQAVTTPSGENYTMEVAFSIGISGGKVTIDLSDILDLNNKYLIRLSARHIGRDGQWAIGMGDTTIVTLFGALDFKATTFTTYSNDEYNPVNGTKLIITEDSKEDTGGVFVDQLSVMRIS